MGVEQVVPDFVRHCAAKHQAQAQLINGDKITIAPIADDSDQTFSVFDNTNVNFCLGLWKNCGGTP
jgi:hypothetical protein